MKGKLKQNPANVPSAGQAGITLIALIITIIILLILAIVSIRLVINNGILNKSKYAVDKYSTSETEEKIQLAYSEYQMGKLTNGSYTFEQALTAGGVAYKTVTGSDKDGYVVTVETKDGEKQYSVSSNGISKVKTLEEYGLQIGDYVNYDPTKDENGNTITGEKASYTSYSEANASAEKNEGRTSGYTSNQTYSINAVTTGWRVLGIENGQIQLISADPINKNSGTEYYLKGEKGYLNAEEELNAIGNLYGQGKGATGGRSLNVEDVNKLIDTGYDPKTYSGYGNKWTYRYPTTEEVSGTRYMQYKTTKADRTLITDWQNISETSDSYQKFKMPGADAETTLSSLNPGTSEPLEYTYYYYSVSDKVKKTASDGKRVSDIITKGTGTSNVNQWLASRCVYCFSYSADFNVRLLYNGSVSYNYLYSSSGGSYGNHYLVRPVVSLKSNIQIDKNGKDGKTAETAYEIK